jgi:hypothetical protein
MVRKRKNWGTGTELQRLLGQPLGNSLVFHHNKPIETFAQRVSVSFWHFPAAFQYPLRIAQSYPQDVRLFPAAFL